MLAVLLLLDCLPLFLLLGLLPLLVAIPQLQALNLAGPEQQRSLSESASPDLSCQLMIAVVSAGPEQPAQDQSFPWQTSSASSRSLWSLPASNSKLRIIVAPARS